MKIKSFADKVTFLFEKKQGINFFGAKKKMYL